MGWVRVDDHFNEHPKLARVGLVEWGLWLAGLAYCNRNLTDGFVPFNVARSLATYGPHQVDVEALLESLVEAELWDEHHEGYWVHDYLDFQPSRAKVLADRKARVERQQRWRNKHRDASTSALPNGDVGASVDADVDALETVA